MAPGDDPKREKKAQIENPNSRGRPAFVGCMRGLGGAHVKASNLPSTDYMWRERGYVHVCRLHPDSRDLRYAK